MLFPKTMEDQKSKAIEIPVEGSLGILALGHVGIKLWREAKAKSEKENPKEDAKETSEDE